MGKDAERNLSVHLKIVNTKRAHMRLYCQTLAHAVHALLPMCVNCDCKYTTFNLLSFENLRNGFDKNMIL